MSKSDFVPIAEGILRYNGKSEPCDMAIGPCSCGAWHDERDGLPGEPAEQPPEVPAPEEMWVLIDSGGKHNHAVRCAYPGDKCSNGCCNWVRYVRAR